MEMYMSEGYELVSRAICPKAEQVYDGFHVKQTITRGVDTARRKDHSALLMRGIAILVR
jgi:transposase